MYNSKLLWLGLFFLLQVPAAAQEFSSETWHDGFVITSDNEKLEGEIRYDQENDLVQVIHHNRIQTYTAKDVLYFEFFDEILNRYRIMYALPVEVTPGYRVPRLFEVLHEGRMSLIAREHIEETTINDPYLGYIGTYTVRELVFDTFFLDYDGKVIYFDGRKRELYGILSPYSGEIKDFVKENRLDPEELGDLVKVTAYYNKLLKDNS